MHHHMPAAPGHGSEVAGCTMPRAATLQARDTARYSESEEARPHAVCRQLAMHVVVSAPSVELQLNLEHASNCHSQPRTQEAAQDRPADMDVIAMQCSIIKQMLVPRKSFRLVVCARGAQPFPLECSHQVTELWLQYKTNTGPASSWLPWSALTNLVSLRLLNFITQADISNLSSALDAGHLPALCELSCSSAEKGTPEQWRTHLVRGCGDKEFKRLGAALAQRVQCYLPASSDWVPLAQYLMALQVITLPYCDIEANTIKMLCSHPTLHTIKLRSCFNVAGDHSERACKWRSLHLMGSVRLKVLSHLPVVPLQEIYIYHQLAVIKADQDVQTLRSAIDQHLSKVKLVPHWDSYMYKFCFAFCNLTADTVRIVSALQTDCWLLLSWDHGCEEPDAIILPALWAALHPSISSVRLSNVTGVDWPSFWFGMPHSVRHIELWSPDLNPGECKCLPDHTIPLVCDTQALLSLVTSASAHVKSLKLFNIDSELRAMWEAAGLHHAASRHLKLELTGSNW